jgi:FixJ family two-component response regulator
MDAVVLIVEDEPSLRRAMIVLLEGLGTTPMAFGSAEEAWSQIGLWRNRCALAFIDVTLPGASGLDLAHRLRDRDPHLPLVMMSGLKGVWSLDALEPVCYMTKPFGLEELEQAIYWQSSCVHAQASLVAKTA